jgi:hypothetical protein
MNKNKNNSVKNLLFFFEFKKKELNFLNNFFFSFLNSFLACVLLIHGYTTSSLTLASPLII